MLGMPTTRVYKSFDSCFQFLLNDNEGNKRLRLKIYNKFLHFFQSEQGKKKISMNLKALFLCSNAFFEKVLRCLKEGMSRLEFSQYFTNRAGIS